MKMRTKIAGILVMLFVITGCKKEKPDTYLIETTQSSVVWTGKSPLTENTGTFSVSGNNLTVKDGRLLNGTFDIPINSLNVTNLPPDLKPLLTNHLLSADFFNALVHPMAVFQIQKVDAFTGTVPTGSIANPTSFVTGTLTMLGVTKPIAFPAKVNISNNKITADALLEIDRTQWGMNHAADPELGNDHIYPMVKLKISLVANKY